MFSKFGHEGNCIITFFSGTRRVEVLNVGVTASTGTVAAVAVVATLIAITTAICTSLACYMNKVNTE